MATLFGNASKLRRIPMRENGAQNIVKRYQLAYLRMSHNPAVRDRNEVNRNYFVSHIITLLQCVATGVATLGGAR